MNSSIIQTLGVNLKIKLWFFYFYHNQKNNVTESDYEYFRDLISTSKCYLCHEPFTNENKPTLDIIDNSKGHSKDNVELACVYCNCAKSNRDEETAKLMINLRKFALRNGLPMSLDKTQIEE